jgi:alkanesulfonate monooxygenase SsuD/methylene tetrahydromethanopterin reductase-like flavin-dependent oxidoreductase (luciferase family)
MIIGAGLDARLGLAFPTLRALGAEAAAVGFASVWSPALGVPDAFHVCAAWAQETERTSGTAIPSGIAVVPVLGRWSPLTLAQQAATVATISGGRFSLGIGTGGSGAPFFAGIGLPNRPIAVMRDFLTITRGLLRGKEVSYDGPTMSLSRVRLGVVPPPVPLLLAALGPQMQRLAGSAADGAALNWATPAEIARARQVVEDGARSVGRDPGEIRLAMYIRVCVDEDVDAARRALATQVLTYALVPPGGDPSVAYRGQFGRMGFDDALTALERRRDAGEPLGALVDDLPDDLLSSVGYFGAPEGAAARVAELADGLDEAIVRVITTCPDPDRVRLALAACSPDRIRAAR